MKHTNHLLELSSQIWMTYIKITRDSSLLKTDSQASSQTHCFRICFVYFLKSVSQVILIYTKV